MRGVRFGARVALAGLGLLLLRSAYEHARPSAELNAHYDEVGVPGGAWAVAVLQCLGGACLLVPRTQRAAAAVVAAAMLLALVSHARRGFSDATAVPLAIFLTAGAALAALVCSSRVR